MTWSDLKSLLNQLEEKGWDVVNLSGQTTFDANSPLARQTLEIRLEIAQEKLNQEP